MNPLVFYPLENPNSHSYVVEDNHYGLRTNCPTPNFVIQDLTHCSSMRLVFEDKSPIIPGIHYIVEHSHEISDNVADIQTTLHHVYWDIALLTKILNSIPLQFKKACDILSKELANDILFRDQLKRKILYSQTAQRLAHPQHP